MTILNFDCKVGMRNLADNSVDSIVTDPPYELGFMGKKWDSTGIAYDVEMWAECLRVLKPGGYLLAFSASRTYHRMTVAIEDAGFDIRDQIMWVYGSGFPKSLDISKAIDKAAGAERELTKPGIVKRDGYGDDWDTGSSEHRPRYDNPATEAAKQWNGWGTALKPAHEPICVARKPLEESTVAKNVLKYGTGGINIDGCRVPIVGDRRNPCNSEGVRVHNTANTYGKYNDATGFDLNLGRWPANIIHDGIDETWARYFYCAKTSKRDRNEGLEGMELKDPAHGKGNGNGGLSMSDSKIPNQNNHPTVKPTELMRYLCRLVTPPGGLVLDPFAGSGSTGKAAKQEGFQFIGFELEPDYCLLANARFNQA